MSRSTELDDFRPTFAPMPSGQIRGSFEAAYRSAVPLVRTQVLADPRAAKYTVEAVLPQTGARGAGAFQYGHLPSAHGALSESLPYRMTVDFDQDDELTGIELTLFFLNPRFILTRHDYIPANLTAGNVITPLAGATNVCGLLFETPQGAGRFADLTADLPGIATTETAPNGYQAYSANTLVSRADISLSWLRDPVLNFVNDAFGFTLGMPGGGFPKNVGNQELSFYNPDSGAIFDALLHDSRRVAIVLAEKTAGGIELIVRPPAKPAAGASASELRVWDLHRQLRQEFGLRDDFTGIICDGLTAHWLDDTLRGHDRAQLRIGATAIAFGGAVQETTSSTAQWYTTAELAVESASTAPVLGVMRPEATLGVSISNAGVRHVSLKGRFNVLDPPFGWLSDKDVVLSLARYPWKDGNNDEQTDWGIELALVGDGERVLAALNEDVVGPSFPTIVTALAFGPLVTRLGALDANLTVAAPDAKTRGFFVEVGNLQTLAQLLAGATFSTLFRNSIRPEELRITGLYVRDQPKRVANPAAPPDERQTALLFDYEADYAVEFEEAGIKTTRAVSTSVAGSGFAVDGDGFHWVQVLSGLYQLSLDDPGLWDLSGLGKLLRIVEVTVRRRNGVTELVIRLRLAGNFCIVKADDFVFVLDLQGGTKLEAYPSEVTVDIPSTIKATGRLIIGESNGAKDVIGSLDLTIVPTKLRMFAGIRIAKVVSDDGQEATAVIASAAVEFPTPLPLASSGLALNAVEALYATHFARNEPAQAGAIPPALGWLKNAGGDVARSINTPALWKPAYDRWSFGLGATLGLVASGRLINLNAVLVVELPGPNLLIFTKVNLLKEPKSNQDAAPDLTGGILGLLQINFARKEITLAALADLEFKSMAKIRAPMELFLKIEELLSNWHFYLGHYKDPITVRLELGGLIEVGAELYFMAAGDVLDHRPDPLPGFALALGFHAYSHIGSSDLYLRVDLRADLAISMAENLYIVGNVGMSGELNLWVVSVGASGSLHFELLRKNSPASTQIHVRGEVCGKVKLLWWKLEGCVSISIGTDVAFDGDLFDLVTEVKLVSGTDAALFGQGVSGPIDASFGSAIQMGHPVTPSPAVPIDSVIAIAMSAPPAVAGAGFMSSLTKPQPNTQFSFAGIEGEYMLQDVRLERVGTAGTILDASTPSRWWRHPVPSPSQPSPVQLALFTRNPFATENAMPDSAALDQWLEAIADDPCGKVLGAQECFYRFLPGDSGTREGGSWIKAGELCSLAIEQQIGRTGVSDLIVTAAMKNLRIPFPVPAAICEPRAIGNEALFVLKLNAVRLRQDYGNPTSVTHFSTDGYWHATPLQLIVALPAFFQQSQIESIFSVRTRTGHAQPATIEIRDLTRAGVRRDFHRDCAVWRTTTEQFVALADLPHFGAFAFYRIDVDLSAFADENDPIVELIVELRPSGAEYFGARDAMFIGALNFTPLAEELRARAQQEHKKHLADEIDDYLKNADIPLLEPSSEYRLSVHYGKSKVNAATTAATQTFTFKTAADPPRKLDPYLLAAFPSAGESFHYTGDHPGLVLASADILRILARYQARLKVTITNDGDRPVQSSQGMHWEGGVDFDPLALMDAQHPPAGIEVLPVRELPSAIRQAIEAKLARGELACLGHPKPPDRALWIGFDVELFPLAGYGIRIDVIDASGNIWPWPARTSGLDASTTFFQWQFKTSLYASTASHASALNCTHLRHRFVNAPLVLPVGSVDALIPGVETVEEKPFEDAIAAALGERSHNAGDPRVTVLWNQQGGDVAPLAVLVESNEPLVRFTMLPAVVPVPGENGKEAFKLTQPAPFVFSCPKLAAANGVTRAVTPSSRFALLLLLDATVIQSGLNIVLGDTPLERIPRAVVPTANAIAIPATLLAREGELP